MESKTNPSFEDIKTVIAKALSRPPPVESVMAVPKHTRICRFKRKFCVFKCKCPVKYEKILIYYD